MLLLADVGATTTELALGVAILGLLGAIFATVVKSSMTIGRLVQHLEGHGERLEKHEKLHEGHAQLTHAHETRLAIIETTIDLPPREPTGRFDRPR